MPTDIALMALRHLMRTPTFGGHYKDLKRTVASLSMDSNFLPVKFKTKYYI